MDLSFTADQLALKSSTIEFASKELNRHLREREQAGTFPHDAWRACARFGIQGLPIPEAFGGSGADLLTTVLALPGGMLTREEILSFCNQHLPHYLVPAAIEFLQVLAKTSTGKTDRVSLARSFAS